MSAEEEKEAAVSNEEEKEESDANMNPGSPLPNSTPKKGQTAMDAIERRRSPRLDKGKTTKKLHDEHKHLPPSISSEETNSNDNHDDCHLGREGPVQLREGMRFSTAARLFLHMEQYAKQNGFLIARNCHTYDIEKSKMLFGAASKGQRVISRGSFYCRGANNCKCHFQLKFTYVSEDGFYVVKGTNFNLEHTEHARTNETVHGLENVQFKQQLTEEEFVYQSDLSKFGDSMGVIRDRLRQKFPQRVFDASLVRREVNNFKDSHFGTGRHRINDLMALGTEHKAKGGVFEFQLDDTMRLKSLKIQTAAMRSYAMQYNDFTMLDGTHGTNKYGLIMEPTTNVDCLGLSVITGLPICESEERDFSTELLQSFGLVKEGAALMTDEGSGFTELAANLGMIHVLCSHHFQMKGLKTGMLGGIRNAFIAEYNKLIYHDFNTEDEFIKCYHALLNKFEADSVHHAGAMKFLTGLYEARSKVCFFYTKSIFTCGHTATTRAEGTNSRIKARGDLKKELQKADLYRAVTLVLSIFDNQEIAALNLLVKLITGDKAWSDFVNDAWRKSATLASNFSDVKEDESLSDEKMQGWSVKSPDGGTCCSVRVPREEGVGHPTGTCSVYMSTLIPCPCICAVYGRIRHELFKAHNLPPRWSLENHPLWRDAHRRLKIKLPLATESSNDKAHAAETELVIDQIQFPNKSNVRHSRLKQKFDKVANLATEHKGKYKHFYALLSQEEIFLRNFGAASADPLDDEIELVDAASAVLPPKTKSERKRGRVSNDDVANRAKRETKRTRKN